MMIRAYSCDEETSMRIGNLSGRLTLFTDGGVVDVERASGGRFDSKPQAAYANWAELVGWASSVGPSAAAAHFEFTNLGAPVPRPEQVFALGLNYINHASEGGSDVPEYPMVFAKYVSSFTGPTGEITLSGDTVDWEVELVAVIGKLARNVAKTDAWDHVAGLTVGQDISDRTVQLRGPRPQMSLGKSFPGYSPIGPWLVTPDEFPNPDDIEISCAVNGKTMQKARTADLVFDIPTLVADLSTILPLYPGDVIFTGTPGGVGAGMKPPQYLQPGDELVTTIEGIGEMRHTFASA
jgi:2,4-didehydro-3-deoxy-L-rhamnonate hydrolase